MGYKYFFLCGSHMFVNRSFRRRFSPVWGGLALMFFLELIAGCKFVIGPKAPSRRTAGDSLIIPESVTFGRSNNESEINLTFETRSAAQCKLGFYLTSSTTKSVSTFTPCVGRSATKFSETITGVPKGQLVSVIVMSWSALADERSAKGFTISETPPTADQASINLLSADLAGGRLEFSSLNINDKPSATLASAVSKTQGGSCVSSDSASPVISSTRKPVPILSATSRGFINSTITKISDLLVGGSFQSVQRQSTEWSITARTTTGFGLLRVARPVMLKAVTFAGRDQSPADDDSLEDVDPSALKLTSAQTFVASWTADGNERDAVATLTISPSGSFKGITCTARGDSKKITVPADMIAKLPVNERLWAVLRLDSWQAVDDSRWLVRVSDWKSLGVQRL